MLLVNSSRKKEGDGKREDLKGGAAGPTGAMDHIGGRLAKIDLVARNMKHVSTQTDLYPLLDLRCVALA